MRSSIIEIDSIEDSEIKREIRELIKNYRLQESKETKVKMNIALNDRFISDHKLLWARE